MICLESLLKNMNANRYKKKIFVLLGLQKYDGVAKSTLFHRPAVVSIADPIEAFNYILCDYQPS